MRNLVKYVVVATGLFLLSCNEDPVEVNTTAGLMKLGYGYAKGANTRVELWTNSALTAGYNKVFVALYDSASGSLIEHSHVTLSPKMTMMGGMEHSCPVISYANEVASDGLFPFGLILTMPSGDMGNWTLGVSVENNSTGRGGSVILDIDVANPVHTRVKSFLTAKGSKIFVSYNFPDGIKLGSNDIEIMIFSMETMDDFIPLSDINISLVPNMPSMEHGSPNNIDPAPDPSRFCYSGKVNFTMTGDWRLYLNLNSLEVAESVYFDVTIE